MKSLWSTAPSRARRIAGLLNGGWSWFMRMMAIWPVGSWIAVFTPRDLRSSGSKSSDGYSHQSCSPDCSAAAAVAASGIVVHSTRSKCTILGPAVQSGVPPGRGT